MGMRDATLSRVVFELFLRLLLNSKDLRIDKTVLKLRKLKIWK